MLLVSSAEALLIPDCSFFGIACSVFNDSREPLWDHQSEIPLKTSLASCCTFTYEACGLTYPLYLRTLCAWNILSLHSHMAYPLHLSGMPSWWGLWTTLVGTGVETTLHHPDLHSPTPSSVLFSCLALLPLNIPYYFFTHVWYFCYMHLGHRYFCHQHFCCITSWL